MYKTLTAISLIILKLRFTKAEKLNVCKWRVFAKIQSHMAIYFIMSEVCHKNCCITSGVVAMYGLRTYNYKAIPLSAMLTQ